MSFSNIQSVRKTASAAAVSGRSRLLGVYFTHSATPATITLRDGATVGGTAKLTLSSPAAIGSQDLILPDIGILFESGVYIDLSSAEITSVTLLFEGGAPA